MYPHTLNKDELGDHYDAVIKISGKSIPAVPTPITFIDLTQVSAEVIKETVEVKEECILLEDCKKFPPSPVQFTIRSCCCLKVEYLKKNPY